MITPTDLAEAFGRNLGIIKQQTEGLTHADSVLQPPVRGNCMNWVLGHIADTRDLVVQKLGAPAIMEPAEAERYGYGSEPICADEEGILQLSDLMARLEKSQEAIAAGLGAITDAELAEEGESFLGKTTLARLLFFLYWHETYHVGQTEPLRQLAGTDDKVI